MARSIDGSPLAGRFNRSKGTVVAVLVSALALVAGDASAQSRRYERRAQEHGHAEQHTGAEWYDLAYDHHSKGEYEDAIAAFKRAIDAGFRVPASTYNVACGYARLGNSNAAFDWLEKAGEAGFELGDYLQDDEDLRSLRGDRRFAGLSEKYQDLGAVHALKRKLAGLQKSDSDDGAHYYKLGLELHHAGDHEAAIDAWQRSAKLKHEPAASTYNVACAYSMMGERDSALDSLEHAIQMGFDDKALIDRDSDLDAIRGERRFSEIRDSIDALRWPKAEDDADAWREALERYDAFASDHPKSGRAWFNVGFAALKVDDPGRAVKAFRRAHDLDFRRAISAYNVACSYSRKGDADRAFDWLSRALDEGFERRDMLETDSDLDNIRDDPRFGELLESGSVRRMQRYRTF